MNEEYLIAQLMHNFDLPYDFALHIVMELSQKDELENLSVMINKFKNYKELRNYYYGGRNNEL